jgi:hypothetical protein
VDRLHVIDGGVHGPVKDPLRSAASRAIFGEIQHNVDWALGQLGEFMDGAEHPRVSIEAASIGLERALQLVAALALFGQPSGGAA